MRTYHVDGEIFFASTEAFIAAFDFAEPLEKVIIDVGETITAVGALDKIAIKNIAPMELIGVNEARVRMLDRVAVHDKGEGVAPTAH